MMGSRPRRAPPPWTPSARLHRLALILLATILAAPAACGDPTYAGEDDLKAQRLLERAAALCALPAPPLSDEAPVRVFLLAGQSNMLGHGLPGVLPEACRRPNPAAMIWDSPSRAWRPLEPGERFGPEIMIGWTLRAEHPGQRLALVKHAAGSTDLDEDWRPTTEAGQCASGRCQWPALVEAIAQSRAALLDAGLDSLPGGIFWMQGESDARRQGAAERYLDNLTRLIDALRLELGQPGAPVVLGRLSARLPASAAPFNDQIRAAQDDAAADPLVAAVDTDDFDLEADQVHFSALGQIALGESMARAWGRLRPAGEAPTP